MKKDKIKCEICKDECDGKLHLKNVDILDKKTGSVKDWILCGICFNAWANHDYDSLNKRLVV